MTIKEIYGELNTIFPKDNSCSWDNDGLMVCSDSNKEVKKVLLALDATKTVIDSSKGYDLILTHHPLIFRKIGDVTDSKVSTSKLITLIKNDTAVMSFHTRFDGGDGGMNDILAKKFELKNIEKFGDFGEPALCRMGDIEPTTAKELAIKAKTILNSPYVLYTDAQKPIKKVAICSGDGGSVINNALSKGADALITGRGGYNAEIDARDAGISIIETGHYYSEIIFTEYFETYFKEKGIEVDISNVGCEINAI